jgi:flagellar hook-associated protein 1 FlgK
MSLFSALSTAQRGLAAASAGISVTSQNVTGAGTDGYSRKRLEQSVAAPVEVAGLWIGQGVDLDGIRRASDRFLGMKLVGGAGEDALATSLESSLKVVEAYFDESSSTGLVEAWDGVFDALSAATANPGDDALRSGVVSALGTLARKVSGTAASLEGAIADFEAQVEEGLDGVNETLAEIASLNATIGDGGFTDGSDLLDRRDQLVRELAEQVGATVHYAADGQATVFIGGHAAVSGSEARELSVGEDADGNMAIWLSADSGRVPVTGDIGGAVGGVVAARSSTASYLEDLDTFAATVAEAFNTRSAAGWDADGNTGGDVFTVTTASTGIAASFAVDEDLSADAALLAFAGASSADAGDTTNLEALLALEDDDTLFEAGTGREHLSALTSRVGSDVAEATARAESAAAVLADLQTARDAVSGVDSDEEAMQLIEYQAAYRAAAQVITATDQLLRELMGM